MDVTDYFYGIGSPSMIQYYYGKSYLLVWDPLGLSNQGPQSTFYTPHNLNMIGTATIDQYGFLSGTAEIPWVGSQSYGEHYIYAVWESNTGADNYLESWWAPFSYEAAPENRYTVDVTVEPAGAGSAGIYPDEASYENGAQITLTATPSYGWTFSHWSGDIMSSDNPEAFYIVSKNYHVTANFIQDSTSSPDPGPCSIAAALLGGPLSQEVAYTRHVRDDLVGSNNVGQAVVKGWNAFYYSWSPPVAYVIASSSQLRAVATVLLTPLLGIVHVVELQYNLLATANSALASILSFVTAAIFSIGIYIVVPIWLVYSLLKPKSWLKQKIKRQA